MYVLPAEYSRAFNEIKRTSLSHSTCKLILFVSCLNIDALCSAKILSIILKKELIQYQLVPVVGYSDLKKHYSSLDSEVTNVIMIGCGAMLDMESFFELDEDAYVTDDSTLYSNIKLRQDGIRDSKQVWRHVYIIDGHRPWNLDNLFGSSVFVCFDDGYVDANLKKEREAYEKLVSFDMQSDGEETDEDEDAEEDEEDDVNQDEDEEQEWNAEDLEIRPDDDADTVEEKERRQRVITKKIKKQRRKEISECEDVIESYYNQGTTIVTSTTAIIYALLSSIGETNIDNLWLAIIGTSSLDDHYPEVYDKIQPLFKDEVHRLSSSNGEPEKTADSSTLTIDVDYHLFLLRHWTLYDSFFYSSHVNSKLNLWTESGRKKLHKLFAKMGVSLAIAQQKWLYMDITVKKQLPVIFSKYLPLYGLESIVREGFIRTFGYTGQLSGIECVESLSALLECDRQALTGDYGFRREESTENDSDDEDAINKRIQQREKVWVNNFWSSWDALNNTVSTWKRTNPSSVTTALKKPKGFDLLLQGLEHAKQLQKIIFRTGMSLLERKLIKNLHLYRLCVLNDGTIPDLKVFSSPLILNKLGTWLLENITEIEFLNYAGSQSLKPLVVASLDVASDTYLVIGLAPKYPRGIDNSTKAKILQQNENSTVTRLNIFSVAFQQIAKISGAKVRIDSFDSSVIEIRRDDLSPFLEKLTLSGLV
ncbi:Piso0_001712 [Millerozyma farinosa CBS 7064]|uniref:Piso0_001712 protein n=1 Tax=Pichia sorbitophila (strain ATCC MYA-4447 / BCRC 22081 / CBS 7064 / NBRC 10061 / NRRL Y-12695) TaxID=559304 RepID=G8YNW6_PICSO|nr:Piso0_001712 [Millerozyma farinosa CBS 7064]